MKKANILLFIAFLLTIISLFTGCSRHFTTGSYVINKSHKEGTGTMANLKNVAGFFFFPTDTLKPGDTVKIITVGRKPKN